MAREEIWKTVTRTIVSRKRAKEIVQNFRTARVLVVGDLMVDHFIWGRVSRISPEAPVPVVEVGRESYMLGGSANVLHNVASMGGEVYVSGVIGADSMGRWLLRELKGMAVDTGGVVVEKDRPTTMKTRIVAHSQQMVRYDRESRKPIRRESIRRMIRYFETLRDRLGVIIISDYDKGVISEGLLKGIRKVVSENRIVTCVDPKRSDFSLYRSFAVITPNHLELQRALGIAGLSGDRTDGKELVQEPLRRLLDQYQFKALLMTRGEEGMTLFERDGSVTHIPAVAREVFDVTGAGDTAIGIFALSLAAGATFKEAAYLANQAAGIAVGKVGTATVTREEILRVL
jgi:rfaE bifunctional protein kinase chain/domain